MSAAFAKPTPVEPLDVAFGGDMTVLMPPYSEIPEEFKRSSNPWVKFQQQWFFSGLKKGEYIAQAGIDESAAWAHLKAIQASWDPKHEHKEAAVAYLASLWLVKA